MSPDDHLLADPFSLPDRRFAADTLGTAVLAWAGNTAQAAIEDWVETSRGLKAPHAEVLDELVAQVLRRRYELLNEEQRPAERVGREIATELVRVHPNLGTSYIGASRLAAGAPGPSSSLKSPSERAIEALIWHLWPALLAFDGASGVFDAIGADELVAPLVDDDGLRPILEREPGYALTVAPGIGRSTYDARSVAASLVSFGVERAQIRGAWPEMPAVVEGAREGLKIVYALATERRVELPALIAFTDIVVPDGWEVTVGDSRLRAAREEDRRRAGGEAGLVLETQLPTRFSARKLDEHFDWRALPGRDEYIRARERAGDLVVLAFALAFGTEAVPRVAWSHLLNPLTDTWMAELHGGQPAAALHVEPKRISDVERWLQLLNERMTRQLEIPARRVVASITERGDPRDALIDAVIAWDGLVGATPETVLRVTAGLTVLLEDDPQKRPRFQKELKEIYKLRSGLVHGSKVPTEREAHNAHARAVKVALESLRRIIVDYPGLAALDAEVRSNLLVVGLHSIPREPDER